MKSRVTVWKYISIYNNLIQGHPAEFAKLKKYDHPILTKLEDLQELVKSQDLETLIRIMCGGGINPRENKVRPCDLREAKIRLEQHRVREAREKDQSQVQGKGNGGEELSPQPPETPLPSSTHTVTDPSSALEMSAPQPHDTTATPSPDEALVSTQNSETHAGVDTSPDDSKPTPCGSKTRN